MSKPFKCKEQEKFLKMKGQELFICEKNSWYKIEKDEKIWDEKLVELFWKEIQKKTRYNVSNSLDDFFYRFIFPKIDPFEINFLERECKDYLVGSKEFIFQENVIFNACIFLDNSNFRFLNFNKNVLFGNALVQDKLEFSNMKFDKEFKFINSESYKE